MYRCTSDGRFEEVNPSLARMFGCKTPEAFMETFPEAPEGIYADLATHDRLAQTLERDGEVASFVCRAVRRDGSSFWLSESRRAVFDENGEILAYEGSIVDVTPRQRSELALLQAKQNAEAANRAKSEFLAQMSHELRTPLNAVIGFAELLESEVYGPLSDDRYRGYATSIQESGRHLLEIINNILDLSKVEADRYELREEPVNLVELAQLVIEMMHQEARRSGISLEQAVPADRAHVRADPIALRRILLNLVANAVKFSREGGRVLIDASTDTKGRVRMTVSDEGIGMTGAEIEIALKPFGQVDSTLSRRFEGTGLGLPLSRSLMELHGGALRIQSEPDQGTTVILDFPRTRVVALTEQ
jgi:PAS domain S-box-containing protein